MFATGCSKQCGEEMAKIGLLEYIDSVRSFHAFEIHHSFWFVAIIWLKHAPGSISLPSFGVGSGSGDEKDHNLRVREF